MQRTEKQDIYTRITTARMVLKSNYPNPIRRQKGFRFQSSSLPHQKRSSSQLRSGRHIDSVG